LIGIARVWESANFLEQPASAGQLRRVAKSAAARAGQTDSQSRAQLRASLSAMIEALVRRQAANAP
jgi:hypothetical protein